MNLNKIAAEAAFAHERDGSEVPIPGYDSGEFPNRQDDWTQQLPGVVSSVRNGTDGGERTHPFEAVLSPIAKRARKRLCFGNSDPIREEAIQDFVDGLIARLSGICAKTLHKDYCSFVDRSIEQLSPERTGRYDQYVTALRNGRIETVFRTFPVMARLVVATVRQWKRFVQTFQSRLRADHDALESTMGTTLGDVVEIDPEEGDAHHGGQMVALVRFEDGSRVAYKPRSITPEHRLYTFLSWMEDEFSVSSPPTPDLVERDGYGWVRVVTQASYETTTRVEEHFRHAGVLACVLHVLCATDCHAGNVIAATGGPVLVDAETICDPYPLSRPNPIPERRDRNEFFQSSVLRTLLVPAEMNDSTSLKHQSGLSPAAETARYPNIQWSLLGTDAVRFDYERPEVVHEEAVPELNGQSAPVWPFADVVADGFRRTYNTILHNRNRVRERAATLLKGIPTRTIPRPSVFYRLLLDTLSNPSYLRDGVAYDRKLTKTLVDRRTGATFGDHDQWQRVVAAERAALLRRDIPRFELRTDETGLYQDGRSVIDQATERSGLHCVSRRLSELSPTRRDRQSALLETCLGDASVAGRFHGGSGL